MQARGLGNKGALGAENCCNAFVASHSEPGRRGGCLVQVSKAFSTGRNDLREVIIGGYLTFKA